MSYWKPLIAALVAVSLFGAYLLDRHRSVAMEHERVRVGRIMPFDFAESSRVTIEGANGRFVVEKEDDGTWYIVEPIRLRADEDRIRAVIDNVHASKKTNPFSARELADYGLDPPEASITVEGTDSVTGNFLTATVLIGGDAPRMSRVYAMVDGEDKVFTSLTTLRNQTLVTLTDLRDRRLLRMRPESVEGFAIKLPSGEYRIERNDAGRWMLDDGMTPANKSMVESALHLLSETRAVRILEGDDLPDSERSGIGTDLETRITLKTTEGEMEVVIGRRAEGADLLYATGRGLGDTMGVVRGRDVAPFVLPRREWMSPRFLWARTDEIEQVEIHSAGTMFLMERGEDGIWRFEDQPDSPIHQRRVQDLIANLSELTGNQLVTDRATREQMREIYGVRDESYELAVVMPDGRTEGFIMARTEPREMAQYLVRIQDNSVWKIDAGTLHMYMAFRGDLRDNRIHHGYRGDVARVVFSTAQGSVELVREGRVWRLHLARGRRQVIPDHLAEQFLYASEELSRRAEVFVSAHPPTDFTVRYENAAGEILHEMTIHARDENAESVYVSSGGTLYETFPESYMRFQNACDELLVTGQQLAEQQN